MKLIRRYIKLLEVQKRTFLFHTPVLLLLDFIRFLRLDTKLLDLSTVDAFQNTLVGARDVRLCFDENYVMTDT